MWGFYRPELGQAGRFGVGLAQEEDARDTRWGQASAQLLFPVYRNLRSWKGSPSLPTIQRGQLEAPTWVWKTN